MSLTIKSKGRLICFKANDLSQNEHKRLKSLAVTINKKLPRARGVSLPETAFYIVVRV